MYSRRRGTALVETSEGILVVGGRRGVFMLPGGAARKNESRRKAAIRELEEETGLKTLESTYLFSHKGAPHKDCKGRGYFRDSHKVFLIKTEGIPNPQHEVKQIAFLKEGSGLKLSHSTREIIERFLAAMKVTSISITELKCPHCSGDLPSDLFFNHPFKHSYCGKTLVVNKCMTIDGKVSVKCEEMKL
jgi:8-oxo-dGTP diphosphatase